jgi:hypothetical protein
MRIGRALGGSAAILAFGLGLASCSYAARAVIRNASGAQVLLWPLSERPVPLKAGEAGTPFVYSGYKRQEALIERGGCLHTYSAPDYSALPKRLKDFNASVVVVINPDMTLSVRERSKKGVEGPEIAAPGFPLRPTTFCGRRGEG